MMRIMGSHVAHFYFSSSKYQHNYAPGVSANDKPPGLHFAFAGINRKPFTLPTIFFIFILSFLLAILIKVTKPSLPHIERIFTIIHFCLLVLCISTVMLQLNEYRFVGIYTHTIIAMAWACSGIILFGLTRSHGLVVYAGFIAIPAFIATIGYYLNVVVLMLPALIGFLFFAPTQSSLKINNRYAIEIGSCGIKARPNNFYLAKRTCIILNKKIFLRHNNNDLMTDMKIVNFVEDKFIVYRYQCRNADTSLLKIDTLFYRTVQQLPPMEKIEREGA